MWYFVAIVSALLFGFAGLFMKVSQMRKGTLSILLLGLYMSGTIGFGIHAVVEGTAVLSVFADWRVWLAGLIIGGGSAWGNLIFMKALDYGPASLTSPLTNMNIVLVILISSIGYGEFIGAFELVGIALLLAAVAFISIKRNESWSIEEKKWFALVALAIVLFAFRNGGLKVTTEAGLASAPILFIAYAMSALWFGVEALRQSLAVTHSSPSASIQATSRSTGLLWGLLAGIFSYAGLQLYALALELGPGSIVAPIFATNSLVIAVGSVLLYKERLTRLQIISLVLLFAGLVLIRL